MSCAGIIGMDWHSDGLPPGPEGLDGPQYADGELALRSPPFNDDEPPVLLTPSEQLVR